MNRPARLLVRTDADAAIGLGHAMRCLALAQAFADTAGGETTFLMHAPPPAFVARARAEGAAVTALRAVPGSWEDRTETALARARLGARWVAVDGYHFGPDFEAGLVADGALVLAFDDHGHADRVHAHLLLNQNLGARAAGYPSREPHTRLLLGPAYALLRRDFRVWDATRRPAVPPRALRVLVTMGGSDPADTSSRALDALAAVPGPLAVDVLVGGANPHARALAAAVARNPHPVAPARDVADMPPRLAAADLAVAAAGGTSWELACVGTPQIALAIADNQRPAAAALARTGAAVGLGWHLDVDTAGLAAAIGALADDAPRRAALSRAGRALVDGQGAQRVLAAMGLVARAGRAAA